MTSLASPPEGCPATTVVPDANGWVPHGTCGYLARPYYPSLLFAVLFSLGAAAVLSGHVAGLVRAARRRQVSEAKPASWWRHVQTPSLAGVFISSCLLAAYVLRAFGTRYQQTPAFVAYSDTFVLVSPILVFGLNCSIQVATIQTFVPAQKLVGTTSDALAKSFRFAIPLLATEQLVASILIAPKHLPSPALGPPSSTAMLGVKLYLFGTGLQQLAMLYALVLALLLHRALSKTPPRKSNLDVEHDDDESGPDWRPLSRALLFSLAALSTRGLYRLVELSAYFTDFMPFLARHEVFFYALECLPALAALGIWAVVHAEKRLDEGCGRGDSAGAYAYSYHELHGEGAEEGVLEERGGP